MKGSGRLLSAALALCSLCLTSCAGARGPTIGELIDRASERSGLIVDGEYNPIPNPGTMMRELVELIERQDDDKIYKVFSQKVRKEEDDLYEKVQEFIRFYKARVTSWDISGGPMDFRREIATRHLGSYFYTSGETYRCNLFDVLRNTMQKEDVGFSGMWIYPVEVSWEYGTERPQGLHIVYQAEDIPEDISIEPTSLETLMELTKTGNEDNIYKAFSQTAQRTVDGLKEESSKLMHFLNEQVTSWEVYTWTRNRETIEYDRATTQETFFYLHTDRGLYRCDIREVLERDNQENDIGFSSISVFPAKYPGENPPIEDKDYERYCKWGRDNMGISIVYWQES